MTELITNGNFLTVLTGWNQGGGGQTTREDSPSYKTGGCARLIEADPVSGTCYIDQEPTTPAAASWWRLAFALRCSNIPDPEVLGPSWFEVTIDATGSGDRALIEVPVCSTVDKWHRFSYDVYLPAATKYTVRFTASIKLWQFYLDDVSLRSLPPDSGSCEDLAWALAGLRTDRAMVKHPQSRYQGVINQVIREAPSYLWPTTINTSITTLADQRRYALSGISTLVDRDALRKVWVEDDDDAHYYDRGRYHIEDNAGTLTLVFHEDPDAAGLTVRLEYYAEATELDCADATKTTTLDREWLLARAMTLLLLEADPRIEDQTWLTGALNAWDVKRQAREAQLRPRYRSKQMALTRRWS